MPDPRKPTVPNIDAIPAVIHADEDLTPVHEILEETFNTLRTQGLTTRDRLIVTTVMDAILPRLRKVHELNTDRLLQVAEKAHGPDRVNIRIRDLERIQELEGEVDTLREWRARLTGVSDDNGRIGKLTRAVEELRKDVGPEDECKAVRDTAATIRLLQRRAWGAVISAAVAMATSGYAYLKSRDAEVATNVRTTEKIEQLTNNVANIQKSQQIIFDKLHIDWGIKP